MSLITLIFGLGGTQSQIGTLSLDALLNEETILKGEVTQYPVEEGSPISDNISNASEGLSISGVVTGAGVILFQGGGRSKLIAAKAQLRLLHATREPITIVTGMDVYENMGIENLRIGRAGDMEQLTVDATFTQIKKAETRRADVPPAKTKGKAKGKAGTTKAPAGKNPSKEEVEPNQSTLDDLINGKGKRALEALGGLF